MSVNLSGFQAYADRVIQKRLHSSLFERVPFLSILAKKGVSGSGFGRPGSLTVIGSPRMQAEVKRELQDGGESLHVRFQTGTVGGGKYLSSRDTTASTGSDSQDQKVRSAWFRWCLYQQPIKVWKNTLRLAGNSKNKIANALTEATEMAMEEALAQIGTDIWTGNPSDQTADVWDNPLGVQQICDTDNTYGNVNRTTYSAWAGRDVTSAVTASLSLIDDANLIQGVSDKGPGIDLVLTTNAIYNKLKQEGLSRGAQLITRAMPEAAQVGVTKEAINYCGVIIAHDPKCPASHMACFTTEDLAFVTHPQANWVTKPFKDQSENPGGDDAVTSFIETMYIMYTPRPWNHILYRSVS